MRMSTPVHEASHAEERPADLAERFVAIPAKRIFSAAAWSRACASRDALSIFVEPDGWHGGGIIAEAWTLEPLTQLSLLVGVEPVPP